MINLHINHISRQGYFSFQTAIILCTISTSLLATWDLPYFCIKLLEWSRWRKVDSRSKTIPLLKNLTRIRKKQANFVCFLSRVLHCERVLERVLLSAMVYLYVGLSATFNTFKTTPISCFHHLFFWEVFIFMYRNLNKNSVKFGNNYL